MRVMVAMSGGVDSSVAAARLTAAGHDVTGVTLKLWGGDSDSGCCSVADVEDARRVAAQLGIPHYTFNMADEFGAAVVEPYVADHAAGATPNPCVACNREIKFGRLLERLGPLGFDLLATGHHARVARTPPGRYQLRRGADAAKDQSYVLSGLTQRELALVTFPVGDTTKAVVRREAAELGLRTAAKAESMEVCFITRGGRERFLAERGAMRPGAIVSTDGTVLGHHNGSAAFTVGQRRGLGVAAGDRRYVVDVDAAAAQVVVGTPEELARHEIRVRDWSFVDGRPGAGEVLRVQCSAHGAPVAATLAGAVVSLAVPRPRVAPGQVVAVYRGDTVVGAGIAC